MGIAKKGTDPSDACLNKRLLPENLCCHLSICAVRKFFFDGIVLLVKKARRSGGWSLQDQCVPRLEPGNEGNEANHQSALLFYLRSSAFICGQTLLFRLLRAVNLRLNTPNFL